MWACLTHGCDQACSQAAGMLLSMSWECVTSGVWHVVGAQCQHTVGCIGMLWACAKHVWSMIWACGGHVLGMSSECVGHGLGMFGAYCRHVVGMR